MAAAEEGWWVVEISGSSGDGGWLWRGVVELGKVGWKVGNDG